MFSQLLQRMRRYPLGTRVMNTVLLFSILVAVVSIVIQLYLDYESERADLRTKVENVVDALSPALSNSLWMLDEHSTQVILDGLLQLPEVYNVSLTTEQGEVMVRGSQPQGQATLALQRVLETPEPQVHRLGQLTILASLENVHDVLMERAANILLAQFFKMLVIVVFFLVVFWWLVSRHLEQLSNYASQVGSFDHPGAINLNRQSRGKDELTRVEEAFNQLSERIRKQNRELQFAQEETDRLIEDAQSEAFMQQELCRSLLDNFRRCLKAMDATGAVDHSDASQGSGEQGMQQMILEDICLALALIRRRRASRSGPFELGQEMEKALSEFQTRSGLKCSTQVVVEEGFPSQVAGDGRLFRTSLQTLVHGLALLNEPGQITLQGQLIHRASRGYLRIRVNAEEDGLPLTPVAQGLLSSLQLNVPAESLRELAAYVKLFLFQLQMAVQQADFGFVADRERGNSVWMELTLQTPSQQVQKPEDKAPRSLEVLGIGLSAEVAGKFERVYEGYTAHLTCLRSCEELDDYLPYAQQIDERPELVVIDARTLPRNALEECAQLIGLQAVSGLYLCVIVGAGHLPTLDKLQSGGVRAVILPDDLDEVLPGWFQEGEELAERKDGLWLSPLAERLYKKES